MGTWIDIAGGCNAWRPLCAGRKEFRQADFWSEWITSEVALAALSSVA
jgi:hypothetical protein